MMPSQSTHPVMSPVVRNGPNLADCPNQQKCGPLGNTQLPPAKRRFSVLAGKRDSSQGGSSVASTIQGQNSTPSCLLNDSRITDFTQHVTSTPYSTQRQSTITPTPRRVQVVITHQHPAEPHRETECVTLYPALHPALLALPLLSAVLKTCLPPSLIPKPPRSLQIHCERELQKGI